MDTIVELKIHKHSYSIRIKNEPNKEQAILKAKQFLIKAIKVGEVKQELLDEKQVLKDLKDIFNIS
jgi:hypothetical protein